MAPVTFTPIYTNVDNVKVKLAGKVQFQSDPNVLQEGELPDALLLQTIVDSETEVELDLRSRYAIPFRSKRTGLYPDLPDHTRRAIRKAVDMMCVMNVLEIDFGRGTHVNASDYKDDTAKHYEAYIAKLLGRDQEGANSKHDRFRFSPPLEDLLLSANNRRADDGFKGMIINTDSSRNNATTYAEDHVNDPSKNFYQGRQGIYFP